MDINIDQINACSDIAQLVKWRSQSVGTIFERHTQTIENRINALNQEIARDALAKIEISLSGIHEHARKPEHKTWSFRLAVIGLTIAFAALVVAIVDLCQDFYGWKQPHQVPPPAPSSNAPKGTSPSGPPAPAGTPPSSKGEGRGELKTPAGSPTKSTKGPTPNGPNA